MIRRQEQIEAFLRATDFSGATLHPLAGDASNRRYVRVWKEGASAMVMDTPAEGENFPAYVAIADQLHEKAYSAPAILARDMQQGFLLLEDFGDDTFTRVLAPLASPQKETQERTLYLAAMDVLAEWHRTPALQPLHLPLYDEEVYLREVALFADWLLPRVMGEAKATRYRNEYLDIWRAIVQAAPLEQNQFVHRDYHADNLMWLPARAGTARVGLLDFQDALLGDATYDVVSLLEDARRDVPAALVSESIAHYLQKTGADAARFHYAYHVIGAQRNCKIVGIFNRLAMRDSKQHYLRYLPRVWAHLERDLTHPALHTLREWLAVHVPAEKRGEAA